MVAKIQTSNMVSNSYKYLNKIYNDKLKLKNAEIQINSRKIRFGKNLEQTVKNINSFTLNTSVKAKLEDGRLILETNKRVLKVNDPKRILANLVSGKKIGSKEEHDIQLVRKGKGNVKFLYNVDDATRQNLLTLHLSESNNRYLSRIGNAHAQPAPEEVPAPDLVDNLLHMGAVQQAEMHEGNEAMMGVIVQNVNPDDLITHGVLVTPQKQPIISVSEPGHSKKGVAILRNLDSRVQAVLMPPIEFEIAQIVNNLNEELQGIEPAAAPELNLGPEVDLRAQAIELLNGKSGRITANIIRDTAKEGNTGLVEAMVDIINNPPDNDNIVITKPNKVHLKRAYNDSHVYALATTREKATNIKSACGAFIELAGMQGHNTRRFHTQ